MDIKWSVAFCRVIKVDPKKQLSQSVRYCIKKFFMGLLGITIIVLREFPFSGRILFKIFASSIMLPSIKTGFEVIKDGGTMVLFMIIIKGSLYA